jgi:peptidoglycan/LPS O-acetylase OafA/YrhL
MAAIGILLGLPTLVMLCGAGQGNFSSHDIIASTLSNLSLLPYFSDRACAWTPGFPVYGQLFPANNALWSIFYEMLASLAFVGLTRLSFARLHKVAISAFVSLILIASLYAFIGYHWRLYFGVGWNTFSFLGGLPRVFYGFVCGMYLYKAGEIPFFGRRIAGFSRRVKGLTLGGANTQCLLAYCGLVLCLMLPFELRGLSFMVIVGLIGPLLILWASRIDIRSVALMRVSKALGWFSYPIYCLHLPILAMGNWMEQHFLLSQKIGISAPVLFFSTTFIVAGVVGRFVDEPVRRLLSAYVRRHLAAAT